MDPDLDVTSTSIADYLTPEGLQLSVEIEQPAVVEHLRGRVHPARLAGGAPIPVVIASFLMRDVETGEPFALATVQRDVTERLAAETALRDLADQRQALLNRLVDAQDAERAHRRRRPRRPGAGARRGRPGGWGCCGGRSATVRLELLGARPPSSTASPAPPTGSARCSSTSSPGPPARPGRRLASGCRRDLRVHGRPGGPSRPTRAGVDRRHPGGRLPGRAEALINVRKHAQAQHVEMRVGARRRPRGRGRDDGVGLGRDAALAAPGHAGC